MDLDHVAPASDGGWQGGGPPASIDETLGGPAARFLQQCCAISVLDRQVVTFTITAGMRLDVKSSELQNKKQSLLHFDLVCPLKIIGIIAGVVW